MQNKKILLVSSMVAAILLVTAFGVTESKAHSVKNKKAVSRVKVEKVKDAEISLNEDADEKGSVTLPDGSTSKDIVIKKKDENIKEVENSKKVEIKRKDKGITKEQKERRDKAFMPPADVEDEVKNEVVNKDGAALYPIKKKDDTKETQKGYVEYITDSEGNQVTMTEFLNKEAADHGSVMLPGGASSRDIVLKNGKN